MNINNADELDLFHNNLETYKKAKIGLLFEGIEIDYPGYQRINIELKIEKKRIGIFSNTYKLIAYNSKFFDFQETPFGQLIEINGIVVDCKGIVVTQSMSYQKCFIPTTIRFNPKQFAIYYWDER